MKKAGRIAVVLGMVGMAAVSAAYGEEIKVGGGGAAIAGVFNPVKSHFEKATGINLIVLQSSPKDGLVDLVNGKLDAAVAAVPLESMVKGAEAAGVKVDQASLVKTEVGKNRTLLFVHPSNTVPKLSKEQVKGIFTGKIVNWKEVGGPDRDIIVVWGKGTPGQNAQLTKEVLDGEAVTADALESGNYAKIRETVAATPEAIGIDPHGLADATVKALEQEPEVASPIIVVTKGKPSAGVQKLIDFVHGAGKAFLK